MRKFLFRLTLAVSLPFGYGCQSSDSDKQEGIPKISISEDHIRPFDKVVSEVSFISLRPPENPPIYLECSNSNLIITDKIYYSTNCFQQSAINVFDLDGKHITSLIKRGEGPEEFQVIQGFHLEDDVLSISSGYGLIKQYILPDFKFSNDIPLGKSFFLTNFHPLTASSWLISVEYTGELDQDGKFSVYMQVNGTGI
jgi:hypothetical protein